MALSGSQKAYLQARSGIARSGATRSGYYQGDAVITIDHGGGPVDVSKHVVYNGWSVSLNLNDEVDTASIALLPSCPFVPQTRSQIKIGLGSSSNLTFAGLILTVQATRRPGPDPRSWYDLQCIDYTAILDAHLVVADYPAQSVTTTILDIIARFTRGNISTAGVAAGLPSVPGFTVINERPSTVLRRITNKLGGGFYLDATRTLRAWSSTIPSPIQESTPAPLTDTLPTLKQFRMTTDASQQRTRVFVEGQRTATLLGVPVLPSTQAAEVPVTEGQIVTALRKVRLGLQLGDAVLVQNPVLDTSRNPPGSILTPSNAIVGWVNLTLESTAAFQASGWAQVASQVVRYTKTDATNLAIPAPPAYGALQAPVAVGAQIIDLPWFAFAATDRPVGPDASAPLPWVAVPSRAQPEDTPVVLLVWQNDENAATVIRTREGSDGYYEHLVQDGRFSADGALARAQAELADFASPIVTYEWETDDLNAEPGRLQVINLTAGTPVSATVRITNVNITPIATRQPPRRQVRATSVRAAGVVDVWLDDPR